MKKESFKNRSEVFQELYPKAPAFRWRQIQKGLFREGVNSYEELSDLPKEFRDKLSESMDWMIIKKKKVFISSRQDTHKAIVYGNDAQLFETVLMKNKRGYWTICVSSQIGCAMACSFCATGTMGFKRNLTQDEIVDQYRFWAAYLAERPYLAQRISNVVFMGMGEPLANYEAVKGAINIWLEQTEMGPTRITVSTVGVLTQLTKILDDNTWPDVRLAVSLHSASQSKRESIIRTTTSDFLNQLKQWALAYREKRGNRRLHLTFEYILLEGINDQERDAHFLGDYTRKCQVQKINVIPYNKVEGKEYSDTKENVIEAFKKIVREYDVDVTQRKTMGEDIDAACGQLVTLGQKK
jgi:23S rRNA (adenine2503-C2)-methyltransferase